LQLSGESAPTQVQIADSPSFVIVAQSGNVATPVVYAVAWSTMHAEYCAKVAVQDEGMALHAGLSGPDWVQLFSCVVHVCCRSASVWGLVDTAAVIACPLHKAALPMAFAK
jgi:hypothetical protein